MTFIYSAIYVFIFQVDGIGQRCDKNNNIGFYIHRPNNYILNEEANKNYSPRKKVGDSAINSQLYGVKMDNTA